MRFAREMQEPTQIVMVIIEGRQDGYRTKRRNRSSSGNLDSKSLQIGTLVDVSHRTDVRNRRKGLGSAPYSMGEWSLRG